MTLYLDLDWRMTVLTIWIKSGVFWKIFATLLNPNLGVIQTQYGRREKADFGILWHVFKLLTLRVAIILPYIQEM